MKPGKRLNIFGGHFNFKLIETKYISHFDRVINDVLFRYVWSRTFISRTYMLMMMLYSKIS